MLKLLLYINVDMQVKILSLSLLVILYSKRLWSIYQPGTEYKWYKEVGGSLIVFAQTYRKRLFSSLRANISTSVEILG